MSPLGASAIVSPRALGLTCAVLLLGCSLSHERSERERDAGGEPSRDARVDAADAPVDAADARADAGACDDCDDGNPCTRDRCEAGRCLHTPDPTAGCELFVQHTIRVVPGARSIEAADIDGDGDLALACAAESARLYACVARRHDAPP